MKRITIRPSRNRDLGQYEAVDEDTQELMSTGTGPEWFATQHVQNPDALFCFTSH